MPIVSQKHRLVYYPVPKVACTSVKHLMYFLNHGKWFDHPVNAKGRKLNIHDVMNPAEPFDESAFKRFSPHTSFVVVRDPLKRFLSAYSNRVIFHGDLAPWRIKKGTLTLTQKPNPSLEEFIDHLEDYQADARAIERHTAPISKFLGDDLSRFDKVFPIEALDDAAAFLSDHTGLKLEMPHKQTGGPKMSLDDLSEKHKKKLRDVYASDYELLKDFYS